MCNSDRNGRKTLEVWKFGGTSVDTHEKRKLIGEMVADAQSIRPVIVVSAKAGTTDSLKSTICDPDLPASLQAAFVATGEMQSASLVAAAINMCGCPADIVNPISLFDCGSEASLDARVRECRTLMVRSRLNAGVVPIVGGFFGGTDNGGVSLFGRGGSDYTAVILGGQLNCPVRLFKNDCDGVYDCDPSTNGHAKRFGFLSHDDALTLSRNGAKVIHDKAAELASAFGVKLIVSQSFGDPSICTLIG